jgi:hypothetical protein
LFFMPPYTTKVFVYHSGKLIKDDSFLVSDNNNVMSIIKDVMNNMLKIVSYTIVDWEKVRNINFQLVLIVFFNVKTVKKMLC